MNRSGKFGLAMALSVVFALGITILLQTLSVLHEKRVDLTREKRFTLSDQTRKVLKSVAEPVTLLCFCKESQDDVPAMRDLLDQYTAACPKIEYRITDPDKNKALANKYSITVYGTIIAKYRDRTQTINSISEENVTNALLKLVEGKSKKVYFLTGHGEHALDSKEPTGLDGVAKALQAENYETAEFTLLRAPALPEDCSVLVLAGPTQDPQPAELESLKKYLMAGGKAAVMVDPEKCPALASFLKTGFGVIVGDNLIVDQLSRMFGGDYLAPVVTRYGKHPITQDFGVATFFPLCRTVDAAAKTPEGVRLTPFAGSGEGSWAETDFAMLEAGKAEFNPDADKKGPLSLAVAATILPSAKDATKPEGENPSGKSPEGRLAVYGNSSFITNGYYKLSGNKDLFLNTVRWLSENENLIAIRPRSTEVQTLMLTPAQMRNVFFVPVVFVPLMVILGGIYVYRVRRKRSEQS